LEDRLLDIDQLSSYLSIKKSSLYAKVERNEIPHFKIGNLLRFRKEDIDAWLEKSKVEVEDLGKEAARILNAVGNNPIDIDQIVNNAIARTRPPDYTVPKGRPDRKQFRGLGEEVKDGSV
jgi:excisionase family DNA binding protein